VRKFIAVLLSVWISTAQVRIPGPGGTAPSAGSTIVIQHSVTQDNGPGGPIFPVDLGTTVHAAGDLVVVLIGITPGVNVSATPIGRVCDSTTNSTCISSGGDTFTNAGSFCWATTIFTCTAIWYTTVSANMRYFGVSFGAGGATSADETISVYDISGLTSNALDQTAGNNTTTPAGATFTTGTYTTTAANEIALAIFTDDNQCSTTSTATAGTGFTLGPKATACASNLALPEYQIYSGIQTGVTASFNTGNSNGNPHPAMMVATFK